MPATDSDRQLGEQFHDRLFVLLPQARHDDDPDHFAAVGAAMRLGLQEGQIEQAERDYNAWADAHGYAAVHVVGRDPEGHVIVDIIEAVIRVAPDGAITVIESRLPPCQ